MKDNNKKQFTTGKKGKFTVYPTEKTSERIDREYNEYLKEFENKDDSRPLTKTAFILLLVERQIDAMLSENYMEPRSMLELKTK